MAKKKKSSNLFWRIFISAIGIALILIAIMDFSLFLFGEKTTAIITTRRIAGSNPGKPSDQRYRWYVDYTFTDNEGDEYSGHTQKLGSDTSVKVDNTIYYFPQAPFLNSLESEAKPNWGQLVYIGLGIFLLFVMNGKKKKPKHKHKVIKKADGSLDVPDLEDYDDSVEEVYQEDENE